MGNLYNPPQKVVHYYYSLHVRIRNTINEHQLHALDCGMKVHANYYEAIATTIMVLPKGVLAEINVGDNCQSYRHQSAEM